MLELILQKALFSFCAISFTFSVSDLSTELIRSTAIINLKTEVMKLCTAILELSFASMRQTFHGIGCDSEPQPIQILKFGEQCKRFQLVRTLCTKHTAYLTATIRCNFFCHKKNHISSNGNCLHDEHIQVSFKHTCSFANQMTQFFVFVNFIYTL